MKYPSFLMKMGQIMVISAVLSAMIGCEKSNESPEALAQRKANCQKVYDQNKEQALDSYEACSKKSCPDGKVHPTADACVTECFAALKEARAKLDADLETCGN